MAGADAEGSQGEPKGVGAARAAEGGVCVAKGGDGLLEALGRRPEDELVLGADLLDGCHGFVADLRKLAAEVEHGDGGLGGWGCGRSGHRF